MLVLNLHMAPATCQEPEASHDKVPKLQGKVLSLLMPSLTTSLIGATPVNISDEFVHAYCDQRYGIFYCYVTSAASTI